MTKQLLHKAARTSRHCNEHTVARRDQARRADGPPDGHEQHVCKTLAAERVALSNQRLHSAAACACCLAYMHTCMLEASLARAI